jgi:hypothetical protein
MARGAREKQRQQSKKERKRQPGQAGAPDVAAEAIEEQPEPAADPAALQLAAEIAEQLGEIEEEPRGTILRVVERLGGEAARAFVDEALAIEAQGGQWLGDGSRKRTPGGVFFRLVRDRTEKPDRLAIFYPEYEKIDPLTPDELSALLADVASWPRAAPRQARLRVAGRPSKVPPAELPPETPYVIFNLESGPDQAPPLSSDLPQVEATTTYRVLAPTAQWLRIARGLAGRPDARIGVTGAPSINPRRPAVITVRATGLRLLVPRVTADTEQADAGEV